MAGRSVKLFLADGKASGILTAEIMNWTGHVIAAPRTRFEDVISREELKRTGVYLLIGPSEETDLNRVYIGEGDEIGKRLYAHNKEKDFWERLVAITSKDMNLTKAHVRFLEGQLLQLLKDARRAEIENKDIPQFDKLPEADIADMETFLEEIQLVLPVIGIDIFKKPATKRASIRNNSALGHIGHTLEDPNDVRFVLQNPKARINAFAREDAGEFIIEAGSIGSLKEASSFHERNKSFRDDAFATERIVRIDNKNFRVDQDISFTSPSAAAVFLFGTSRNGRNDWLVEGENTNYGQWKAEMLDRKLGRLELQL